MATPHNEIDEGNQKDVLEHSGDADDDLTQAFNEKYTSHYPEKGKLIFDEDPKYGT